MHTVYTYTWNSIQYYSLHVVYNILCSVYLEWVFFHNFSLIYPCLLTEILNFESNVITQAGSQTFLVEAFACLAPISTIKFDNICNSVCDFVCINSFLFLHLKYC